MRVRVAQAVDFPAIESAIVVRSVEATPPDGAVARRRSPRASR